MHLQEYLGKFRDIDAYSAALSRAPTGKGEASPAFLENWKKALNLEKWGTDGVHLWVKFSIQNVV